METEEKNKIKNMRKVVNHIFLWLILYAVITNIIAAVWGSVFPDMDIYISNIVATIAGCTLVYLLTYKRWPFRPFARQPKKMTVKTFCMLLGMFGTSQLVSALILTITEAAGIEGTSLQLGTATAWMWLYAALLGPVVEELLYRGFVAGNGRRLGTVPAMLLSAFAFGLMHANLSQFIVGMIGGMVLAYVFAEYSIWWALLIHMINNTLSIVLSMLPEQISNTAGIAAYVVIGVLAVYAIVQLIKERDSVRAWLSEPENRGEKGTLKSVLTSGWFIIYTVFYAAIIIAFMIFPEITEIINASLANNPGI